MVLRFCCADRRLCGKTRLAQELGYYAREIDVNVLWGRCYEDSGVPPYWPWIEIVRGYLDTHGNSELRQVLGSGAGDLAEIVPEIREMLPDIPVPEKLEQEEARFRLFDSIRAFIKRAAVQRPILLILDNLHCADRSSLRLLEILAQDVGQCPFLVVGSC